MESQPLADAADAWIAALNAHRVEAVVVLMDADATFEDPTTDSPK